MSTEAPNWYVTQYIDKIIYKFQSRGHRFKGMVAEPGRINGNQAVWPVAGKGEAQPLQRGGFGSQMNASRTQITATMSDWQAADWVYETDIEKTTANEMEAVTTTAANAIGRRSDLLVINELNANSLTMVGDGTTAFGLVAAMTACQILQSKDVDWDGNIWCGLPSLFWNQLLSYKQFSDADWVGYDDLPLTKVTTAKRWNGVNWFLMPDSYSPIPAANQLDTFMWHKSAVGYATNYDVRTNVTWENIYTGWYHNNRFAAAAKVLLPEGAIRLRFASNAAITIN